MKKMGAALLCAALLLAALTVPVCAAGAARGGMDGAQERFTALTDSQKEEVYALSDRAAETLAGLYEKYKSLGVLDAETADMLSGMTRASAARFRTDGQAPGILPPPAAQQPAVPRS